MSDSDRTAALPISAGPAERQWATDNGYLGDEGPVPADLGTGLADLGFIRAALRRSTWLWIASTVIGLLGGAAVFVARPPAYQAESTLLQPAGSYAGAILDQQEIAQSRAVAGQAVKLLGLHVTAASFANQYTVLAPTDRVLQITAKATSGDEAVREADAVASAFLTFQAKLLTAQDQLSQTLLQGQVTQAQQKVNAISHQIGQLSAVHSAANNAEIATLNQEKKAADISLATVSHVVDSQLASMEATTKAEIGDSRILDRAVLTSHSRLKLEVLYVAIGMLAGLAIGTGIVVVRALISDRLRRRDDVARALGAPVKLSVGKVSSRGVSRRGGITERDKAKLDQIVAHLRAAMPPRSRGVAALAVVPVDDPTLAAVALVALARACTEQGWQVVVADLCRDAPAAHLLGANEVGIHEIREHDRMLVVAVPEPDEAQMGPFGRSQWLTTPSKNTTKLAGVCRSADLLLTLAPLEPSLGGDHLASWAQRATVIATAGAASAERIRAVGEMIRLAGVELVSAVLTGADKTDESLGAVPAPSPAAHDHARFWSAATVADGSARSADGTAST
jgi:capsular polysaccharide biosynthesis protein